ncbi:hypothetical protein [Pleurocapsa sp. PCC 7319]|uniref:hypothetical protein n=1 Tax=Pleurocapsa sp. PCC 7319 TaxID=118161 RepID=UPI00034B62F4|nr:hypothetical protein [Pleurocapsa sp. PCC 7319]
MRTKKYHFWLAASIFVAIAFSCFGFKLAFQSPYTIQDDARQHVFWLQKFSDRYLFTNDLIADYFSSVAPLGYKFLYWFANFLGVKPFLFSKILPVLLGIITTIYIYFVTIALFPVPFAGFMASLLLNQNLWMLDDLVSGTPRAFFYVLFLGFIYYLLRQRLIPCLLFIILQGLFYPQVVLISAGILIINLIKQKSSYFYFTGLVLALGILAIYKLKTADFSQVMSLTTAKQLPEFYAGGRNTFFLDNPWLFWLAGPRSGFFPREWQYVLLCSFGLSLPWLTRYPRRFPLVKKIKPQITIVGQILLVSLALFFLSHLLLFQLHLPSRYSQHTWRIIIALVDGITLAILLNSITKNITHYQKLFKPLITAIAIGALLYPTYAVQAYPYRLGYVTGTAPELYQFLEQQPKDILIASLSKEADFIPSLAQRSVLVAEEYSIPYHLDYYQPIRRRTQDLITAQYSLNQAKVNQFIQKYHIDLWLLDKNAFQVEHLLHNPWLRQFKPETENAILSLKQTKKHILATKVAECKIFQTRELVVLDTKCIKLN